MASSPTNFVFVHCTDAASMYLQWETCSLCSNAAIAMENCCINLHIHFLTSYVQYSMNRIHLFCLGNCFLDDHHLEGNVVQVFIPVTQEHTYPALNNPSCYLEPSTLRDDLRVFYRENTLCWVIMPIVSGTAFSSFHHRILFFSHISRPNTENFKHTRLGIVLAILDSLQDSCQRCQACVTVSISICCNYVVNYYINILCLTFG